MDSRVLFSQRKYIKNILGCGALSDEKTIGTSL